MKDKLNKKTKNLGNEPLVFTDDGFAIGTNPSFFFPSVFVSILFLSCSFHHLFIDNLGIAYILKLLDQNKDFDSLHWFESVKKRYEQDQMNVHNSVKNKSKEDTQTAQITLKKLAIHMQEFDLLKYPASSFSPSLYSPFPSPFTLSFSSSYPFLLCFLPLIKCMYSLSGARIFFKD